MILTRNYLIAQSALGTRGVRLGGRRGAETYSPRVDRPGLLVATEAVFADILLLLELVRATVAGGIDLRIRSSMHRPFD